MRKILLYCILLSLLLPSCGSITGHTTRVVKPRNHKSWFNKKKHKRKKRTRIVRMKS